MTKMTKDEHLKLLIDAIDAALAARIAHDQRRMQPVGLLKWMHFDDNFDYERSGLRVSSRIRSAAPCARSSTASKVHFFLLPSKVLQPRHKVAKHWLCEPWPKGVCCA